MHVVFGTVQRGSECSCTSQRPRYNKHLTTSQPERGQHHLSRPSVIAAAAAPGKQQRCSVWGENISDGCLDITGTERQSATAECRKSRDFFSFFCFVLFRLFLQRTAVSSSSAACGTRTPGPTPASPRTKWEWTRTFPPCLWRTRPRRHVSGHTEDWQTGTALSLCQSQK